MKRMCDLALLISLVSLFGACTGERFQGRTLSSWAADLSSDKDYSRRQALEVIAEIGPKAASTIPHILPLLDDVNEGVQAYAVIALVGIGDASVPDLEGILNQGEPKVRLNAATALAKIDPTNGKGTKVLYDCFSGLGNIELAKEAGRVIEKEKLLFLVEKAVGDPSIELRLEGLRVASRIGKHAKAMVPVVLKLAESEGPSKLRATAISTAANIGTRLELEEVFKKLTEDSDEEVAATAGVMLRYIGARSSVSGNEGHVEEKEAVQ
ncbi:MAG: HEAT repeat domain-containing protein [Myxococcota bacterium]|nr:HEAT repeat domain-containing protein [Myxococcota bacterium]